LNVFILSQKADTVKVGVVDSLKEAAGLKVSTLVLLLQMQLARAAGADIRSPQR